MPCVPTATCLTKQAVDSLEGQNDDDDDDDDEEFIPLI